MDREAIAYMLFISSALYLKGRNIKPFCQEALYIYCCLLYTSDAADE